MTKERFISLLTENIHGCTQEMAQTWARFAEECVEQEQYVDFEMNPLGRDAAVEDWMDTLYAGLDSVKSQFGSGIAGQIAAAGLIPFYLYPYEMKSAAEHLRDGGKAEDFPTLCDNGLLEQADGDEPMFPKLPSLSGEEDGESFGGMTMS